MVPYGVAVDWTTGYVYATVQDTGSNGVIIITTNGTFSTYGSTPTNPTGYNNPSGNIVIVIVIVMSLSSSLGIACDPLAIDGSNTIVYVADKTNNVVRRITPTGVGIGGTVTNYGTSITLNGIITTIVYHNHHILIIIIIIIIIIRSNRCCS